MKNLEKIIAKYSSREYKENYSIGGGLDYYKLASRRHEDAKCDDGKLTLGKANQMFAKATGLTVEGVKEILLYAVPNMEWHHAGLLPKAYGGGMKKTYFLNSSEIVDVATNWNDYTEKLNLSKISAKNAADEKKNLEVRKLNYLQVNAKKVERATTIPSFFYKTAQEMNGKYGWFDSSYKSYNMTEYFTGWAFETEEKYNEFLKIN